MATERPTWSRGFLLAVTLGDSDPEDDAPTPAPRASRAPAIPSEVVLEAQPQDGVNPRFKVYPVRDKRARYPYPRVNYSRKNFQTLGVTLASFVSQPGPKYVPQGAKHRQCCRFHTTGPPLGFYPSLNFNPLEFVDCAKCQSKAHVGCLVQAPWQ